MPAPTIIAGRYRLDGVAGRGGMSTVYRATDTVLGRTVAVKLLPEALAEHDRLAVARFEREARAAAALSHPAVVAIYDTGSDGASRFIVMEFVEGRSLSTVLREEAPLQAARAARIASGVADALAAAHGVGIVHRDIKPANVMLTREGAVKVLDFGIARALVDQTLTETAAVIGTAAYMAPERAAGGTADERSDIYSLGCLLYAMLSGGPPFTGDLAAAVLHQHLNVPLPPLRDRNPAVPGPLALLTESMLAKDPAARPQTAAEVRDGLEVLFGGDVTAATAPLQRTGVTQIVPAAAKRKRWMIIGAGAAALALVIAVLAEAGDGGHRSSTGSTRPAYTSTHSAAPSTTTTTTVTTSVSAPAVPAGAPPAGHHHQGHGAGAGKHGKKAPHE